MTRVTGAHGSAVSGTPKSDLPAAPAPESDSISLFIVDDHEVVRAGLVAAFTSESGVEVVGSAEDGERALTEVSRLRPGMALVDYRVGAENCVTYPDQRLRGHQGM